MTADPEVHAQDFLDAVGDVDGSVGVFHPVDHRELAAAQPRHRVAGAEKMLEPAGDAHQELVSDGVAEAVVYVLEAVEIEVKNREIGLSSPLDHGQGAGQTVHEAGPVGEPGLTVVEGVVLQLVLGPLAGGDVAAREPAIRYGFPWRRTATPRARTHRYSPAALRIRCSNSKCSVAPSRWASTPAKRRPVVGVDADPTTHGAVAHVLDPEIEHRFPVRRKEHPVGLESQSQRPSLAPRTANACSFEFRSASSADIHEDSTGPGAGVGLALDEVVLSPFADRLDSEIVVVEAGEETMMGSRGAASALKVSSP